jgi:hypothetical protein
MTDDRKTDDQGTANDPAAKGEASGGNMGYGGAGELREEAGQPQDDSASDED